MLDRKARLIIAGGVLLFMVAPTWALLVTPSALLLWMIFKFVPLQYIVGWVAACIIVIGLIQLSFSGFPLLIAGGSLLWFASKIKK